MPDGLIVAAVALIAGLIAIIKPIIDLNTNIAKLTTAVTALEDLVKEKTEQLDKRITKHGEEIDDMKEQLVNHEVRISNLEK